MGDTLREYPFPLSERAERSLNGEMLTLLAPWKGLDDYPLRPGDPHFLTCFYHWHNDTKGLVESLKYKCWEMMSPIPDDAPEAARTETMIFESVLAALLLRFEQLDALIKWTYATWRDDPAIQAAEGETPEQ